MYSGQLNNATQRYAESLAASGNCLVHSNNGYGENLYYNSGQVNNGRTPVDSWYREYRLYDYNSPVFSWNTVKPCDANLKTATTKKWWILIQLFIFMFQDTLHKSCGKELGGWASGALQHGREQLVSWLIITRLEMCRADFDRMFNVTTYLLVATALSGPALQY